MNIVNKSLVLGAAAHAMGSAALCAPRSSASRRCFETLAFTTTWLALYYGRQFSTMYDVNYVWAFYMSNYIFHLNSLLNIYCYAPPPGKEYLVRFRLAIRETVNPRGLGMKWEHRGNHERTKYKTKISCLSVRLLLAVFAFAVICLWDGGFYSPLFLRREDVAPEKEHFLRRLPQVTLRELVIRVIITVVHQAEDYFTMLFVHCAISIVGLTFGDGPDDWPYMFGKLGEAYTIRRYWTYVLDSVSNSERCSSGFLTRRRRFWQPFLYNPIRSHASFVAHRVLRIPKNSKIARYVKVSLGFLLSGVIHLIADFALYRRVNCSGQLSWAAIQVGGLLAEDFVLAVFQAAASKTGRADYRWLSGRLVGYAWVFSFLVWSIPRWKYRSLYNRWNSFASAPRI